MPDFDRNDPRSEHARKLADHIAEWQHYGAIGVGAIVGILVGWDAGVLTWLIAWIASEVGIQMWENHRYL